MASLSPLPTPTDASVVRVDADLITIEHLVVRDQPAAAQLTRGAGNGMPVAQTLTQMLQIGARTLEQAQAGVQVDLARAEFQAAAGLVEERFSKATAQAASELTGQLQRYLDPAAGELSRLLQAHADGLQQAVQATFDSTSTVGVPYQLTQQVRAVVQDSLQALLTQLAATNPASPLTRIHETLTALIGDLARRQDDAARQLVEGLNGVRVGMAELRGAADAAADGQLALQAEQARSVSKGFDFEDRVAAILTGIAHAAGDLGEDVSGVTGEGPGRSKKGDYLVGVGEQTGPRLARVVYEMKHTKLTIRQTISELSGAMAAREADFAVLVVPSPELLPRDGHQFGEIGGDRMLVALTGDEDLDVKVLQIAHRVARTKAMLNRTTTTRIDAATVSDASQAARTTLRTLSGLTTNLATLGKGIEQAKSTLGDAIDALLTQLHRIEQAATPSRPA